MELNKKNEFYIERWYKAAIFGSLWAAIEIILGSFLHNLKIPFTGSILACIGIFILTVAIKNWSEPGLALRIGMICALMKSISPSAVIFGPMIGIFLEAFIFEISTLIFGRNLIGFLIGGGLAVTSNLLQKIINLFIVYGNDLVKIYYSIYDFAAKMLGNPILDPNEIIILLFVIEFALGVIFVSLAYSIKKYDTIYNLPISDIEGENKLKNSGNYKEQPLYFLFMNISAVILILYSFSFRNLILSVSLVILFIFYADRKYSIRSLYKPRYLLEFTIIVLVSGLLGAEFSNKKGMFSISGLYSGLDMILRASTLIVGFSLMSKDLRNPKIINWLLNKKMKSLYESLDLAFSTLPLMSRIISSNSRPFRKPIKTISYLLSVSDLLIRRKKYEKSIFIISGEVNGGKSTLVSSIIITLKSEGYSIGGLLSEAVYSGEKKSGYDILDISSGIKKPFLRSLEGLGIGDNDISHLRVGKFTVIEEGLEFGKRVLSSNTLLENDIIIIDEIGHMELRGLIWSDCLSNLLLSKHKTVVLVIREKLLENVLAKFKIIPKNIFYPDDDADKIVKELMKDCRINFNSEKNYGNN